MLRGRGFESATRANLGRSDRAMTDRRSLRSFDGMTDPLPFEPSPSRLAARLFLCLLCRRSLTLCQARDHGKSGSLIRSSALLPRSKLGTRHTQTTCTCTLPPDNRQNAVVSNRFGGSRPRRSSAPRARRSTWRGDRHLVRCRWREPAARWRAPRLGAAEVRRLHHSRLSRTLPHHSHWEWCSSYGTAHRSRAPLPCAIRSGGGPGGVLL